MRFPEFSREWEKQKINSFTSVKTGATPSTIKPEYWNGNIKWMSSGELNDKRIYDVKGRISELGLQKSSTSIIPIKCVLIGLAGQGKTRGTAAINYVELCTNQSIAAILPSNNMNPEFLYQNIESRYQELRDISSGDGGRGGLNLNIIGNLKVPVCSLEEQEKISSFLNLLDERIATQIKIISNLQSLIKGITDKAYSNINGKTLSYRDIFTVVNERNKNLNYTKILSASQELGMVDRNELDIDIKFEKSNINTYKIIQKGDYVIHLRSFQGGFAFSDIEGVCSPAYIILRPSSNVAYAYFKDYFTSDAFIKSLRLVTYGIRDGRSINVDEWLSMKVALPSKQEQEDITNRLGVLRQKLHLETQYLYSLMKQKQYLLRTMFI